MKALILKDLYNIGHNSKQMLVILLFFAFIYIPTTGFTAFAIMAMFLCSAMIMTTFHFDKTANWEKYALTLPISKSAYIQSKYVTSAIFCIIGGLFSIIVCGICIVVLKKGDWNQLILAVGIGLYLGLILSGILIAAIIKFGAENARNVLLVIVAIPFAITLGLKQLVRANQVVYEIIQNIKNTTVHMSNLTFVGIAMFGFLIVVLGTYFYSYRCFSHKEW